MRPSGSTALPDPSLRPPAYDHNNLPRNHAHLLHNTLLPSTDLPLMPNALSYITQNVAVAHTLHKISHPNAYRSSDAVVRRPH